MRTNNNGMIKCTGVNCTMTASCLRYEAVIDTKGHFEGNQEPASGCCFYIPDPSKDASDDMAIHSTNQNKS